MEQATLNFNPPSLSPDEVAVLGCLQHGRESATSSTEIERRTGLTVRRIQEVILDLRMKHGEMVMAAVKHPRGYYIAQTQDEIVDYVNSLMSRALKELKVAAKFRRVSLDMIFAQAKVQEGEG